MRLKTRKNKSKTVGIEPYVIDCIVLRLHENEALTYLADRGFKISAAEYYTIKKEIQESSHQRLNQIGSSEFLTQHIQRIDTLKTIENELWSQYKAEKLPTKKASILMNLAEIQQFLSSYYDSTAYVLQTAAKYKQEQNEKSIS